MTAGLLVTIDDISGEWLRLAWLWAILILAPAYLGFGFAAFAWAGFISGPASIWATSATTGLLYGLGGRILFGPVRSRWKRFAAFLALIWGVPVLVALVLSAVP